MSEEGNETVSVRFEVLAIERVNRGRLVGLAVVEIDIAGVSLKLVGIQIMQHSPHILECNPPTFRHGRTGEWLPAVILPPELGDAIASEVLAAFRKFGMDGKQPPDLILSRQ